MGKQLFAQLIVQPDAEHDGHADGPQVVARGASTQQVLLQVPPMGQTAVAWHTCVQLAVLETQTPLVQSVLSAQSEFRVQPGAQRGWFGSAALQPEPSGQSELETQPARQLFELSGFAWQIWPLVQSESREHSCSRKQALARHW